MCIDEFVLEFLHIEGILQARTGMTKNPKALPEEGDIGNDGHGLRGIGRTFPAGSKGGGTIDFRKHAGFVGYAAFLDLEDDQELLKYSKRVRSRGLKNV